MSIRPKSILALLMGALCPVSATAQTTISPAELRQGFNSPPPQAKLRCYWWWLNGNTTEETITYELTEMSRKGFGGVLLVDANGSNQGDNEHVPPGPTFGSPAWTKLYVRALRVAAELHLEVTLNITSGWNLGGPDVVPADASKVLTFSRITLSSQHFDGNVPAPPTKNGFYRGISVLAYPLSHGPALPGDVGNPRKAIALLNLKTASAEGSFSMPHTERLLGETSASTADADTALAGVLDISRQVDAAGHTNWRPPNSGPWEILRIGYTDSDARVSTSSGQWQGLAIDYLDRAAFDTYWNRTVVPLLEAGKPYLRKSLINLATDSWELGGTNWTGRFQTEFRTRRGYDPIPYLPVIAGRIVTDRATSERFLNDLRRTVGDLITDHYDHMAERAKQYGLGIQCESGGPHSAPLDALETFRSSAIPQTEYWAQSTEHRSTDQDRFFTKEAASAANIYGKNFVAQEGMTTIGPQWSESLARDLKPSFDQALTEGMNRLVWHEFTSSPASFGLPGNEYFAGTHLNPRVTWWNQGGDFFLYLNRSQFLLQQGHAVDDVLYFYGDEVPNFVRLKQDDPAHVLPGYDYDVTNEDALLHNLTLNSGRIENPAGNAYKVVMMPKGRRLSLASLERIAEYVRQGGSVAGLAPLAPTGLVDQESAGRFSTLTHSLWDKCPVTHAYGTGTVFCTENSRQVLQTLGVRPDFDDSSHQLDYIHRKDGQADIYFVRNGSSLPVESKAVFRATGSPELWNAVDGTIKSPAVSTQDRAQTTITLNIAPFGSTFVIFAHPDTPHAAEALSDKPKTSIQPLPASQWTISYQPDRGAPIGTQPVKSFSSWTESPDPGIRYFSGTATYTTQITHRHADRQHTFLALSDVREIATIRINGRPAGTIWSIPYRLDVTASLKEGQNTLEINVTNLWPNRIIGDAQPNVTHKFTRTNIRKYTASSSLLPSGLLGPVSLETITDVDLPAVNQ